MRVMLVAAGYGLLLAAPSASAQSLAGVAIGDSEAKVLKTLAGATSAVTKEDPNLRIVFTGKTTVWVCKGVVYSIQDTLGSTLTDYLSLVERETAKRGKPTVASGVSKVGKALQGWMRSTWSDRASDLSIEIRHTGAAHVVSSSLTGDSTC